VHFSFAYYKYARYVITSCLPPFFNVQVSFDSYMSVYLNYHLRAALQRLELLDLNSLS